MDAFWAFDLLATELIERRNWSIAIVGGMKDPRQPTITVGMIAPWLRPVLLDVDLELLEGEDGAETVTQLVGRIEDEQRFKG
jgi:hypothetical protein